MIAVPATHSYLGEDLVDIHSRSDLRAGDELVVPLIRLGGVVLFPGEALPLRITESRYVSYLRSLPSLRGADAGQRATLAVMGSVSDSDQARWASVGTLAEACSISCAADEVRLLARGRHRFALLGCHRDDGVPWARVRVMDEGMTAARKWGRGYPFPAWVHDAHDPFLLAERASKLLERASAFRSQSMEDNGHTGRGSARRLHQWLLEQAGGWAHLGADDALSEDSSGATESSQHSEEDGVEGTMASSDYEYHTGDDGSESDSDDMSCPQEESHSREHSSSEGAIDDMLSLNEHNGEESLASSSNHSSIHSEVEAIGGTTEVFQEVEEDGEPFPLSLEPVSASFRIAANIVASDAVRQELLNAPNAVTRLRMIIEILEKSQKADAILCCSACGADITSKHRLCKVPGAEGEIGAYVNPHGQVHQTVTFTNVLPYSAVLYGRPTERDTWFPGYAWTIASCSRCGNHLGWKFSSSSDGHLKNFWGIRRAALKEGADSPVLTQTL